jgi:hypothetical protein
VRPNFAVEPPDFIAAPIRREFSPTAVI